MPSELRDIRLIQRAMEQRWPIKPEFREALVKRLVRIIASPESTPREVSAAARALLSAESQNQADEHKVVDVHVSTIHDRLDAIAADLGIEVGTIQAVSRETGSSVGSDVFVSNDQD